MWPFAIPPLERNQPFDTHMRRLTYPPESHRPLLSITQRIKASAAAKMRRSAQRGESKKNEKENHEAHVGEAKSRGKGEDVGR
jgi:hypothetical protein